MLCDSWQRELEVRTYVCSMINPSTATDFRTFRPCTVGLCQLHVVYAVDKAHVAKRPATSCLMD